MLITLLLLFAIYVCLIIISLQYGLLKIKDKYIKDLNQMIDENINYLKKLGNRMKNLCHTKSSDTTENPVE